MEQIKTSTGSPILSRVGAFYRQPLVQSFLADRITLFSGVFVLVVVFSATFAPFVAPYPQDGRGETQNLRARHVPPMSTALVEGETRFFMLGTDYLGRDLLSRIIYGGRISMTVAFAGVVVSGILGVFLGLMAGFYRGIVDDVIMRAVDIFMAVPLLFLALILLYVLGPSFTNVILVFAVARWMLFCRITRGVVLSLREQPFVDAARAIGCSDGRIIGRHVLPNLITPIFTVASLELPRNILTESALSFLGLGIQPPESSWGLMLASGRNYIVSAWWEVIIPGMAIFLTACTINLFGVWMRAVSDPLQRWRWLKATKEAKRAGVGP
jgi:peptide/nickel transport system permease protein